MIYSGAIISLVLVIYWMAKIDAPTLFAPIVSCGVVKPKIFSLSILIAMLITLSVMGLNAKNSYGLFPIGPIPPVVIFISAVSAFITMFIATQISKFSSVCYAFMAALAGCGMFMNGNSHQLWDYNYKLFFSWLLSPVIAMICGAVVYIIYTATIGKIKVHIITLSLVMKYFLLLESILLTVSFAINNRPVLFQISGTTGNGYAAIALLIAITLLVYIVMNGKISDRINIMLDKEFDINYPAALSIALSTSIVLLIFSSRSLTGIMGLVPTPVAVPSLMFMSLAGIGLVKNRVMIEQSTLLKMLGSIIGIPVIAIIISYVLCYVVGHESVLFSTVETVKNNGSLNFNFILFLATAIIGSTVLFFINYQHKLQNNQRIRIITQQQFIDENRQSVNDIEVKTILAENQSLHNKLENKRKELIDIALNINEQKEFLESVYNKVRTAGGLKDEEKDAAISEIEKMLFQRMMFSQEIDSFYTQAEQLHKDFSIKLKERFPNLTEHERRLATLLRLGFSTKEIASLMNISVKSGEISRYRLRKKLNITRQDNLIQFIKSL